MYVCARMHTYLQVHISLLFQTAAGKIFFFSFFPSCQVAFVTSTFFRSHSRTPTRHAPQSSRQALQHTATHCNALFNTRVQGNHCVRHLRACCNVLQCVAVCCSMLQCVAMSVISAHMFESGDLHADVADFVTRCSWKFRNPLLCIDQRRSVFLRWE